MAVRHGTIGACMLAAACASSGSLRVGTDRPVGVGTADTSPPSWTGDTGPAVTTADTGLPPLFALEASTELVDGRLVLRANLPGTVAGCAALPERDAPCGDADGDTLVDAWEDLVLEHLRPAIRLDEAEPLVTDATAVTALVGRVAPAPGGGRVRAFIMLGYSRDYGSCGLSAHNGDSERVALDLLPLPAEGVGDVRMVRAYTAAHEGTLTDASRLYAGGGMNQLSFGVDPNTGDPRWLVYSSARKHATFGSVAQCEGSQWAPCLDEDCDADGGADPAAFTLLPEVVNAGEPDAKLVTDLGPIGFPGEDAWAFRDFCGGLGPGGGCAAPVREKLLVDPFP